MKKTTHFQTQNSLRVSILLFCLILCTPSLFANNTSDASDSDSGDLRKKIRLEYNSPSSYIREIVVIADENATDGYDSEFDIAVDNIQADDMYWIINQGKFMNQAINSIDEETVIEFGINTNSNGMNSIAIDKLDNIPSDFKIFVHDKELGIYHSIKEGAYEVYLSAGTYLSRFEIVFSQPDTLGTSEFESKEKALDILFDVSTSQIKVLNNLNLKINSVEVYSILGQSVYRSVALNSSNELKINSDRMRTGTYIVMVSSETGIHTKKILVN